MFFQLTFVVSREAAYQWFGNPVTIEWWSHLWLNEWFVMWVKLSRLTFLLLLFWPLQCIQFSEFSISIDLKFPGKLYGHWQHVSCLENIDLISLTTAGGLCMDTQQSHSSEVSELVLEFSAKWQHISYAC